MISENRIRIRNSIATKLLKVVFSLYLAIAVAVTLSHMFMDYRYQKSSIRRDLENIQRAFARGLALDLWQLNQESLQSTVEGMLEIPVIVGVKIRNTEGIDLAVGGIITQNDTVGHVGRHVNLLGLSREESAIHANEIYKFDVFQHQFPIMYRYKDDMRQLGDAVIYSNSSVIFRRVKLGFLLLIINLIVTTAALWCIFLWFSHTLLRKPLASLASAAGNVSLDNLESFKVQIETSGRNELKLLEESFNVMIENLHRSMTEREQSEQEVRHLQNYLSNIIDSMPSMLIGMNADGLVTQWNKTAERVTKIAAVDAQGKMLHDVFPRMASEMEEIHENIRRRDTRQQKKRRTHRSAEGLRYEDVTVYPLVANGVEGAVIRVDDVTEQVRLEQRQREKLEQMVKERTVELEKSKEDAEAANRAKSIFLANMSHELRSPLNAVLGYSEILSTREHDPQKKYYLEAVRASGNSLLSLIDDVLDLSRIESGKLELQYRAVSMSQMFEEMKTIFHPRLSAKKLECLMQIDENVPEALLLDETRLRQILINLLGNAVKFTEQGFVRLACKIVECEGDSLSHVDMLIEVQDSGKGIAPEDRQRIFDAFEQAKGQKTSQYGGTGLGLAISRNIVHVMNGTLSVESVPGEGSSFCVTLRDVEVAAGEDLMRNAGTAFDSETLTFEPATVLIADDIDYNREILAAYLRPWALTVFFAANGRETLAQAQQRKPDLILLDMKMPQMDGYEASRQLKQSEATRHIPIIAVTASALKHDEESIRHSCDGYLRKPVSQADLLQEMMKFLAHTEKKAEALITESNSELASPPQDVLNSLYESALDGDMDSIITCLDSLEKQDAALTLFCRQLRELALEYQDGKIISLLTQYVAIQEERP